MKVINMSRMRFFGQKSMVTLANCDLFYRGNIPHKKIFVYKIQDDINRYIKDNLSDVLSINYTLDGKVCWVCSTI